MTKTDLDATFAALADPVRRAIITRLSAGEATPGELASPFSITPQAISKHLKVLESAGLITRGRDAQRRPCRLRQEPLAETADWIAAHRRRTEERYDRLTDLLHEMKEKP